MSIPMCRLGEPVSRPDKWQNEWVWGKETGLWHKNLHYGVEPERPEHPIVTLADHLKKAGLTWEELAEKSGRSLEWLLSINDGEPFGASSAKPLAEPLGIHERHLIELAAANQERARRIVRKRGKSATDLALASGVPETRVMQFLAGCAIPVSNVRALLSEPTVNGEGSGDFGKWVRERRLELGMSAHALSKAANVSAVTVANVEKGLPYHGLTRRKIERVLSIDPTNPEGLSKTFGKKLADARYVRALSRAQLADRCGIDSHAVERMEAGKGSGKHVDLVCDALEIDSPFSALPGGEWMKSARLSIGLSRAALASLAGISSSSVGTVEGGARTWGALAAYKVLSELTETEKE